MTTTSAQSKFRRADGRLTAYSFACGYVEKRKTTSDVETTLWQENGCYHVRQHDHKNHIRVFWNCHEMLDAARKDFDQCEGELL